MINDKTFPPFFVRPLTLLQLHDRVILVYEIMIFLFAISIPKIIQIHLNFFFSYHGCCEDHTC